MMSNAAGGFHRENDGNDADVIAGAYHVSSFGSAR
jgi:hypothetical protein